MKLLQGPSILHLATHGFFRNDLERVAGAVPFHNEPGRCEKNFLLRSGLAFAGGNVRSSETNDEGILTALEAAQLDLSGTELVVLSACESNVGEVLTAKVSMAYDARWCSQGAARSPHCGKWAMTRPGC